MIEKDEPDSGRSPSTPLEPLAFQNAVNFAERMHIEQGSLATLLEEIHEPDAWPHAISD